MKNLKRALSVVLSAAMMISLLAVGASAASIKDFSDKDEITHTEAVSTLVELGVVAGKDTGNFDPTGIVTRAEMTKMICVVLNGGKDPQLSATSTVSYKDTVGHWAAAYIEYCTNLGIVAGDGTGNFNPNATVTGTQAAKMLLVAMGYKSDIEGFTGAAWATAVDVRANQKGLYDDMDITTSAGLSRDDAAQMVYNAVNANVVDYTYTLVTGSNGQLSSIPTLEDKTVTTDNVTSKVTLLEDKFNAVKVEGIVVGNEYANLEMGSQNPANGDAPAWTVSKDQDMFGSKQDAGKTKVQITNYQDGQNVFGNTKIFNVTTGADVLGRKVVFYVKPSTTSRTSADKASVLGNLMVSSDNTVATSYNDDKPKDVLNDNNLDLASKVTVYSNYVYGKEYAKADLATWKGEDGKLGQERVFIDSDNDGDVDTILINNYALGKVTAYSTSDDGSMTANFGSAGTVAVDDKDDVVGFADVAKDDYVMGIVAGGKLHVSKADSVTGNLDSYKGNEGDATALTVDGTKYTVSNADAYSNLTAANVFGDSKYVDTDATYYLDAQGYIVAVDANAVAGNYAYVKAADTSSIDNDRVKLVLQDGTTKTYDVDDNSKLYVNGTDVTDGTHTYNLVSYTVNSDGEVKMTAPTAAATAYNNASFTKNYSGISATTIGTKYATSSTVFFYVKYNTPGNTSSGIDSVDVYTGYTSAPSLKGSGVVATYALNSGNSKVEAVVFDDVSTTATNTDDHLFLYKWSFHSSDYSTAMAYVPGNSEAQEIKVDSSYTGSEYPADTMYLYTINSDGYYELKSANGDVVTGTVKNDPASGVGATVAIAAGEYKVTADTVSFDNTNDPGTPTATTGDVDCDKGDTVSMLVNSDNEILMLVKGTYPTSEASILSTTSALTWVSANTKYTGAATLKVSDVKAALTVSDGADVYVVDSGADITTAAKLTAAAKADSTTLSAGDYTIVVVSANGTVTTTYALTTA